MLLKYPVSSWSILKTSVLNCISDKLTISSLLSCIFSGALICSFIWAFFFWSRYACYVVRGRALGVHQGRATHITALWCCMLERGPRGNSAACSSLCQYSVTFPATHNQTGPFWCWFLDGWACVRSRTLWVSPADSPVRLGVSPTATSIPTGVFSQRFLRLYFSTLKTWVARSVSLPIVPPSLSSCKYGTDCSISHHLTHSSPHPRWATTLPQVLSTWLPMSSPLSSLDECFFFNSLVVGLP